MIKQYRTDDSVLHEISAYEDGCWIQMIKPSIAESQQIAAEFDIDIADVRAALDDEESSRIELEDGYTLILVDIPTREVRNERDTYTTIPLGIILCDEVIITVCAEDTPVLQYFTEHRVRDFSTKKRMRFIYQIMMQASSLYQTNLRIIDKRRQEIEEKISDNNRDPDLIGMHELESTLVYFATSLRANGVVLDRLSRYTRLKQYPEDRELLDDVIVENKQAIEMTSIYRDIINGTSELLSTIINNRLNNIMKFLTSITLVMAIPTIISGLFGMNVSTEWMPLAKTPYGFGIICVLTLIICVVAFFVLRRRKLL
ncbi:MAG: magnesium transporter CorA family protein [Oscillospiraceae bacterium]|nr:magnesium transporter CorA family protein [Oscillospiraceae bacterium]